MSTKELPQQLLGNSTRYSHALSAMVLVLPSPSPFFPLALDFHLWDSFSLTVKAALRLHFEVGMLRKCPLTMQKPVPYRFTYTGAEAALRSPSDGISLSSVFSLPERIILPFMKVSFPKPHEFTTLGNLCSLTQNAPKPPDSESISINI